MTVRDWSGKGALTALMLIGAMVGTPLFVSQSLAFQEDNSAAPGQVKPGEQEVVIKREALKLTDPKLYRVPLHLQAAKTVVLTAPADGIIRTVSVKPGQKVNQQGEAIRLDDHRATLVLKRAKALLQAARHEKQIALGRAADAEATGLAEARLEAAQADVELAQHDLDQSIVRAPFTGEIERVFVVDGQFVRAGERLAVLADPLKLIVEIPVERPSALVGESVEIRVEEATVKAKVESVAALSPMFESLRELTVSPASAVVSIENGAGKFASGQTVYCDLIPLLPVTLVPTVAVTNVADGSRRVQVLRESVIRDLTVRILGKVGTDNVFVSGRFNEGDEVVVSSTRTLADGTPLRAILAASSATGKGGTTGPRPTEGPGGATKGSKPPVGF